MLPRFAGHDVRAPYLGDNLYNLGMGIFKKLSNLFASRPADDMAYWVTVRCRRCGEVIRARVDLRNELSREYGEDGEGPLTYITRKTIMGSGRCFQRMEVYLKFDEKYHLLDREIQGGEFVDGEAAAS